MNVHNVVIFLAPLLICSQTTSHRMVHFIMVVVAVIGLDTYK